MPSGILQANVDSLRQETFKHLEAVFIRGCLVDGSVAVLVDIKC